MYGLLGGFILSVLLRLGGGEPALDMPHFLPYPMVEDGIVLFPFRMMTVIVAFIVIIIVSEQKLNSLNLY